MAPFSQVISAFLRNLPLTMKAAGSSEILVTTYRTTTLGQPSNPSLKYKNSKCVMEDGSTISNDNILKN
jgi:hypothetical protein